MTKRFNIRVYALISNGAGEILVSDEMRHGRAFTKFPGGGLEWGEGLKTALERELMEELGLACQVGRLFYVNDFFQASAFRAEDQLLSFYYEASTIDPSGIPATQHAYPLLEEGEKFRWLEVKTIRPEMFTFPIDQVVAAMLRSQPE
ncbi:MAG: hypothetical protein A3D92_03335 [Bacteroidetes bacterium RIFCSPHIGHO2_02_FULL_44_7]|nr:MAG: hypothetical protein A3D92_03335 [Bacteroidetes bacterium RIFCSPHIGHO2_02_FULL_44_7]